jgi:hypothetical protein
MNHQLPLSPAPVVHVALICGTTEIFFSTIAFINFIDPALLNAV